MGGLTGDSARARSLGAALVEDSERTLGSNDPGTAIARSSLAYWTGKAGDVVHARELAAVVVENMMRVLGPDDRYTLLARPTWPDGPGKPGTWNRPESWSLRCSRTLPGYTALTTAIRSSHAAGLPLGRGRPSIGSTKAGARSPSPRDRTGRVRQGGERGLSRMEKDAEPFVCTKSGRFLTIAPLPAAGSVKSARVPEMARQRGIHP